MHLYKIILSYNTRLIFNWSWKITSVIDTSHAIMSKAVIRRTTTFSVTEKENSISIMLTSREASLVGFRIEQNFRSPIRDSWAIAKSFRTTITTMPSPGKISRGGVRPFADNTNGLVSGKIVIAMRLQNSVSTSLTDGQVNVCKHHELYERIPRGGRGPYRDIS